MKANYTSTKSRILRELREIAGELPIKTRHRILNRIDALAVTERKAVRAGVDIWDQGETSKQIADRYVAREAIFKALTEGRHITIRDSREFRVSQMHTQICVIRHKIEDRNLPWTMCSSWVELSPGKRCKEYWLEERETAI